MAPRPSDDFLLIGVRFSLIWSTCGTGPVAFLKGRQRVSGDNSKFACLINLLISWLHFNFAQHSEHQTKGEDLRYLL